MDNITAKKLKENLTKNEDKAFMSKELATIEVNAPITITIDELGYNGPDMDKLIDIYQELKFKTLLEKIAPQAEEEPQDDIDITIVSELSEGQLTNNMAMHIEMMDENYLTADILGISLVDDNQTLYIPFDVAKQSDELELGLKMRIKRNILRTQKRQLHRLEHYGFSLEGIEFDLLLAAYIVNPSKFLYGRCIDYKRIWLYGCST